MTERIVSPQAQQAMTRNRGVLSQRKIMQVMPGQHQGVDRPESCPNRSQDLVIIV